jgi:TP901 family phage tail tape measure protein
MSKFSVTGFLGMDSSKLKKGLGAAGAAFGIFAGIATAAFAAVGAAVGVFMAVFKKSLTAFTEFEHAFNEVLTLLPDITARETAKMKKEIIGLSQTFGFMTEETVPALYQAISAGVPQANVMTFLGIASKAAIAGVTDLKTAVDGITTVMNAYGAENISARKAADLMFTTVKLGKTTFEELSSSLYNVLPLAAAAGVNMEQVSAGMATLTAAGVPSTVATTQLRAAIQALMAPSGRAGDMMRMLGIDTEELKKTIAKKPDGLLIAMQQVAHAANDDKEKLKMMVGSVEALNAILTITRDGSGKFTDSLFQMAMSAGAVDKAFETMDGGLKKTFDKVKVAAKTFFVNLGDALAPVFDLMVPALKLFANVLNDIPFDGVKDAMKKFADTIKTAAGPLVVQLRSSFIDLGDTLFPLTRLIGSLFTDATHGAGFVVRILGKSLNLLITIMKLVMAVLNPLITLFTDLLMTITGANKADNEINGTLARTVDVLTRMIDKLTDIIQYFIDWIGSIGTAQTELMSLGTLSLWVKTKWLEGILKIKEKFEEWIAVVRNRLKILREFFGNVIDRMADKIAEFSPLVADIFIKLVNLISKAFSKMFDFIQDKLGFILDIYEKITGEQIKIHKEMEDKLSSITAAAEKERDDFIKSQQNKRAARDKAFLDAKAAREAAAAQKEKDNQDFLMKNLQGTLMALGADRAAVMALSMDDLQLFVKEAGDKGKQMFNQVAQSQVDQVDRMKRALIALGRTTEEEIGDKPLEEIRRMWVGAGTAGRNAYNTLLAHEQKLARQEALREAARKRANAQQIKDGRMFRNMTIEQIRAFNKARDEALDAAARENERRQKEAMKGKPKTKSGPAARLSPMRPPSISPIAPVGGQVNAMGTSNVERYLQSIDRRLAGKFVNQ